MNCISCSFLILKTISNQRIEELMWWELLLVVVKLILPLKIWWIAIARIQSLSVFQLKIPINVCQKNSSRLETILVMMPRCCQVAIRLKVQMATAPTMQEAKRISQTGLSTSEILCKSVCYLCEQCLESGYLSQFNHRTMCAIGLCICSQFINPSSSNPQQVQIQMIYHQNQQLIVKPIHRDLQSDEPAYLIISNLSSTDLALTTFLSIFQYLIMFSYCQLHLKVPSHFLQ